jgi:hypothetical protein
MTKSPFDPPLCQILQPAGFVSMVVVSILVPALIEKAMDSAGVITI